MCVDSDLRTYPHTGSDTSLALTDNSTLPSSSPSIASPEIDSALFADAFPMLASAASGFDRNVSYAHLPMHAAHVCASFNEALSQGSPITMLPNYEISPSGRESGTYLVVDLGGSTLRVAVIAIAGPAGPGPVPVSGGVSEPTPETDSCSREARISIVASGSWSVDNACKTVNRAFFEWICSKIHHVLAHQTALDPHTLITTGITWSFPLQSTAYNKANIFHMAKGYAVDSAIVGCDLKDLIEATMQERHGIALNVQSIINDSLAVFSAARFLDPTTSLAMVLGTGLNFCCQLTASDRICASKLVQDEAHVLYNTETSLFGHSLVPSLANKYDCIIDSRFGDVSPRFLPHMALDPAANTIFQPFELLTSGRYLPELARLVLADVVAAKEIFASQTDFRMIAESYRGFTGELMCFISESKDDEAVAERIEQEFQWQPKSVSLADIAKLKVLMASIIRRAAYIVAIAIVAFIKLLASHNGPFESDTVAIGYVGSILEYFGSLRRWVLEYVNECEDVSALGVRVVLRPINESSLVGTAIAAASQSGRTH